jgi:hypothetical protein
MSNLLVIDWDYFFYNPMEAGDFKDETVWLFDWGHNESPMFTDWIWPIRASGFMRYDLPLPDVTVPEGFWDRFTFSDTAVGEVSDSNMYSGVAFSEYGFDHVWLFDAHHDLYTIKTQFDLDDWRKRNQVTCEDWMYAHFLRGAKLHWRWPQWHTTGAKVRGGIPKWVKCDARKDDMGKLDKRMVFDAVSICRSGAWVPPWCDQAFETFYQSCPVDEMTQVDDVPLLRAFDVQNARREADVSKAAEARARAEGGVLL